MGAISNQPEQIQGAGICIRLEGISADQIEGGIGLKWHSLDQCYLRGQPFSALLK
jgi:hypothetical protein